jgi:hypothetical protein
MSFRRSICLIFLLLYFLCFPATAYAGRLVPGAKHGATGCGQSFCGIQDHAGSSHPARINPPLRALGDLCVSTAFPMLILTPWNGSVLARMPASTRRRRAQKRRGPWDPAGKEKLTPWRPAQATAWPGAAPGAFPRWRGGLPQTGPRRGRRIPPGGRWPSRCTGP